MVASPGHCSLLRGRPPELGEGWRWWGWHSNYWRSSRTRRLSFLSHAQRLACFAITGTLLAPFTPPVPPSPTPTPGPLHCRTPCVD